MITPRAQPSKVLTTVTPAIANGRPVVPANWAVSSSSTTAIEGAQHIHAIKDPDTYKDGSGIVNPPSAGMWTARWTVRTLPDPTHYPNSFYWLGQPTSVDGSSSYGNTATHQWNPDGLNPGAPAFHSFFPFKPSVTAVNHYLQGGGVVHHPKGVNFNTHFIEHMWMDWGSRHPQPFTWIVAATVTSWPSTNYTHYILDSGRNPDAVGFPRLTANQVDDPRSINDNLTYRNLLSVGPNQINQCARLNTHAGDTVRARTDPTLRPRMYIGIFNGANSYTGAYSPGKRSLQKGHLTTGQDHRFYVLGRKYGSISQHAASHLLVFEIRYWNKALNRAQLESQYSQISSTWQFDKYRGL